MCECAIQCQDVRQLGHASLLRPDGRFDTDRAPLALSVYADAADGTSPSSTAGSGQVIEDEEHVVDRDLGSVDATEHERDPSGPAVHIEHDTRLRDLTLVVDERSEVTRPQHLRQPSLR